MALMYWRENRTYFHVAQAYGVSDNCCWGTIRWVENALIQSGVFRLPGKKKLLESDVEWEVVLIDATETPVERPKKTTTLLFRKKEAAHAEIAACRQSKNKENPLHSRHDARPRSRQKTPAAFKSSFASQDESWSRFRLSGLPARSSEHGQACQKDETSSSDKRRRTRQSGTSSRAHRRRKRHRFDQTLSHSCRPLQVSPQTLCGLRINLIAAIYNWEIDLVNDARG